MYVYMTALCLTTFSLTHSLPQSPSLLLSPLYLKTNQKSSIQKAGELGVKQAALPTPQQRTPRSSDIDFLPLALNSCLSRGPSPTLPLNRLALDDIDQRLRGASRSPPGFVGIGALRGQEEAARQYLSRRDEDDDDAGFDNARRRKTVDYYEVQ